jgi:hypothetical protein
MTDESQPYIPPSAFEVIRSNRKNPPCGEADYFTSDETRNRKASETKQRHEKTELGKLL